MSKQKKIAIIAHFSDIDEGQTNGRFSYIAERLASNPSYQVELISSDFSHTKKTRRTTPAGFTYKVSLLHEPEYKKNVGLKRLYAHARFAKNLRCYLRTSAPDLIYCAVPSLDAADAARAFAKEQGIPFLIDIQDIWPEAFRLVLNVPVLSDLLFAPMYRKARRVYRAADEIIAVSESYAEIGKQNNEKVHETHAVYLGTALGTFDRFRETNDITAGFSAKNTDEIWLAYIGTLGHNYNIEIVIDALTRLKKEGLTNIVFKIMGDGPLEQRFQAYAKTADIRADFMGRLPYPDMVRQLCRADIAVNPIADQSVISIINKVGDYAAACLPVINIQKNEEYQRLIRSYHAGINCRADIEEVTGALRTLCGDDALRAEMGAGNRKLAEEKFDRTRSYEIIYKIMAEHL